MTNLKRIIFLLIIAGILLACRLTDEIAPTPAPTVPPSVTPSPTHTPAPTPTPTLTPTPSPSNRLTLGDQAFFNGDWEQARAQYQNAFSLADTPEVKSAALLGIGRVYFESGDYPNTLSTLRELVEAFPNTPQVAEAFFTLGRTFDTLQRYNEAADAYQSYVNLRPGLIDHYAQGRRGNALLRAGLYPEAISAYQAALGAPHVGEHLNLEINLAQAYSAIGDYPSALTLYQDIASRTGNDYTKAQMDLLSGQILSIQGRTEEAYERYLHAVENYPLAYDAYRALVALVQAGVPVNEFDRGFIDYHAGQYGVAIAAFDRFLAANPQEGAGSAHFYKGLSLRALNDYLGALEQWDLVIQNYPADPSWANAWEEKAFTQWAYLEQYDQASQTLEGFATSYPTHPLAAEYLSDASSIAERAGNLARAAALWERVAVDYPASDVSYRALFLAGITQYRLGEIERSRETFQRTVGLATTQADLAAVHLWIGKAEARLGETTAARAAWERAAMADPTGYYSERARDLLLGRTPFEPPDGYDLAIDWSAERERAESWIKVTFQLAEDTDFNGLGPLAEDTRLLRGAELWRLGLFDQARLEFEDLRRTVSADPNLTYRLTNYLVDLGLYRSAIIAARNILDLAGLDDAGTLTAPIYFNRIRFGTYYSDLVNPLAAAYDYHPLFIYSVMRQESLFEPFIGSSAGALGLMQIIPSTGRFIHELNGWPPNYSDQDLYRPKVSLTFGVDHLYDLREVFGGDLYATLAGYNAGQGRASVWKNLAPDDQDLYLEVVWFDETRRYIRGIYEIFSIYRRLYDRSP